MNQVNAPDLNVHPEFFVPFDKYTPKDTYCDQVRPCLPPLWRLVKDHFWTYVAAPVQKQITQGWKIHVSCTLKDADTVLQTVMRVCAARTTEFKFASDEFIHRKLLSKTAARQSGGKFITVYPQSVQVFELLLEDLYQALRDVRGPYILSDRQYKDSGAVFYRYGGFRSFTVQDAMGRERSMILDASFAYVEDQRLPHFNVPAFVEDKHWGQEVVDADAAEPDTLFGQQYEVESVLKFSNAGGVYAGRRISDGLAVVIKEARPLVDAEVDGIDSLSRLQKEQRILTSLQDTDIAPKALGWFVEWEHTFLVQEKIEGETLRSYSLHATRALYPGSSREEVVQWISRAALIGIDLIGKVQALHRRGIVFGDLSTNNIIVDEATLSVRLIDFEGAYEPGVDPPINIYTPGFRSKARRHRDCAKPEDDVYALGCVLLSLLSPSSLALDVMDHYAERALLALRDDIGLPDAFADCLQRLLREPEPDLDACIALLRGMDVASVRAFDAEPATVEPRSLEPVVQRVMDYLRQAMDLSHSWRPFPMDAYTTDLIALDHGVGGIALAWRQVEGEVPAALLDWLERLGRTGTHLPGLLNGLCGLAWVQCDAGRMEEAAATLGRASGQPLLYQDMTLGYGYAGFGLTCLKMWHATQEARYLREAERVGAALLATAITREAGVCWGEDAEGVVGTGLHRGGAGIALFLLYLHQAVAHDAYLDTALRALDFDISCGRTLQGMLGFAQDTAAASTILYPYLGMGTAGVATVALRAFKITGQQRYADFLDGVKCTVAQKYTASCDLFLGLAGLGHYLLDAAQLLGDDSYRRLAWRAAKGLEMFEMDKDEGLCFPAGTSTKISCTWGNGGAGVMTFLDRLAHDKPNGLLTLDVLLQPAAASPR